MNKIFKTEEIVEKVLREYEDSRNDNFILIYRVYREINEDLVLRELFFEVMMNHTRYGIPSFETIVRCRRKLMNEYPELKPIKEVEEARKEEEILYMEYASNS